MVQKLQTPKKSLLASGDAGDNFGWWSGIVVSALASINVVNQYWAQLVLRRVTD